MGCQAMKIQRFLFFSVNQCDRYEDVPLMDIKYKTERFLAESGLNYTTFRLCGFIQAIIGNYALPILEERPVWGTTDMTRTAYIDSGDAARLALAAVDREETIGKTLDLSGPRPLAVPEIIALCERYAGQGAQVRNVPVWLLNATRAATNFFQFARRGRPPGLRRGPLLWRVFRRAHGGDLPLARGGPRGHDRRREVPARVLHPDPAEAPRSERREQARGLLPVGDRGPAGARSPLYT